MKLRDFQFIRRIFFGAVIIVAILIFFIAYITDKISRPDMKGMRNRRGETILSLIKKSGMDKKELSRYVMKERLNEIKIWSRRDYDEHVRRGEVRLQGSFIPNEKMSPPPKPNGKDGPRPRMGDRRMPPPPGRDLPRDLPPNGNHIRENQFEYIVKKVNDDFFIALEQRPHPRGPMPFVIIFSIIAFAIVGVVISFLFFYIKVRGFSYKAHNFIEKIQSGELSTRFRVSKKDAFYDTMSQFNVMASKVEELFYKIKRSEEMRINILQELSHDLRTPIASLKNLIETLRFPKKEFSIQEKEELMNLINTEVVYFEKLIEDLLMWARINEPKYQMQDEDVDLTEALNQEVMRIRSVYKDVTVEVEACDCSLKGNSYLMKRMLRNLLENAVEHSKNKVWVAISSKEDGFDVEITDNGQGFSDLALKNFGKKKFSRVVRFDDTSKLSIGLGSVIVADIVRLHGGQIEVLNKKGGSVILHFPVLR